MIFVKGSNGVVRWSKRTIIEGSLKQSAWTDEIDYRVPVEFSLKPTAQLIEKAKEAFLDSSVFKPRLGAGPALRTYCGPTFKAVDIMDDGTVYFVVTETWMLYE